MGAVPLRIRSLNQLCQNILATGVPATVILIGLLWAPQAATAAPASSSFCLYACPEGAPASDTVVVHHIYALANNPKTKFADWVAYKISSRTMGSNCSRNWKKDPDLASGTLKPTDYTGIRAAIDSDRGHQAPLASLCGSQYWYEANYLSNITPQKSDLNEGPWKNLEDSERALVTEGTTRTVYSLTGTLYEHAMDPLPRASVTHTVPSGYWKIVAVETPDGLDAVAFVMPQETPRDGDFCETRTTIRDVEKKTGLRFFLDLNATDRNQLEKSKAKDGLYASLGCE